MLETKTQIDQVNVIEKKYNNFKNKYLNIKMFNRLIIVTIIFLGVWYVASINDLSIKGYLLKDLKDKKSEVGLIKHSLELKIMDLSSLGNLDQRVKNLKLVAAGAIDYVSAQASMVAKK